jgi:hypothetical protein
VVSGARRWSAKTLREAGSASATRPPCWPSTARQRVNAKLGTVPLKEGDTLLLLSTRLRPALARPQRLSAGVHAGRRAAALVAAGAVRGAGHLWPGVVAGLGLVPCCTRRWWRRRAGGVRVLTALAGALAVDLDVLVVIAASFGLGAAIQGSGLAALLGSGVVSGAGGLGPWRCWRPSW